MKKTFLYLFIAVLFMSMIAPMGVSAQYTTTTTTTTGTGFTNTGFTNTGITSTGTTSLIIPVSTVASTTVQSPANAALIAQLAAQIQNVRAQLNVLLASEGTSNIFITTMGIGSRGDAVKALQAFLASDVTLYPEGLITGFYGTLTTRAVARFQARHGLPATGIVDANTLTVLRAQSRNLGVAMQLAADNSLQPCTTRGAQVATGWLRATVSGNPIVPTCAVAASGAVNLAGSTTVASTFVPGTITPGGISNISGANLTPNSVTINWNNAANATGRIFLSTSSPVNLATATQVGATASGMTGSLNLTGLAPNTQYFYVIQTTDASGNVSRSQEYTFTTPAATATTGTSTAGTFISGNQISGVTVGNISGNSATVTFNNSGNATSRILFGTSCPVNSATATTLSSNTTSLNQSFNLTGLQPNTVHCFVIQTADASGNVISSPQLTFTTGSTVTAGTQNISGINVTNLSGTGATIGFNTNTNTTGRIFFATSCPINISTASSISGSSSAAANQSINLTGLQPNTTYCFVVQTTDASGNVVTSTQQTFTTGGTTGNNNQGGGINVSATSNGATVTFTTANDIVSSRVFFSTTCPVNTATAQSVSAGTTSGAQSVTLSNLSPNTTYCLVVQNTSNNGTVFTTTEQTFRTNP